MNKELIGRRLRELRGVFRTQAEVADATGIDRTALSRYESGAAVPPDTAKIALASYYGVSVESIFYASEGHEACQEGGEA